MLRPPPGSFQDLVRQFRVSEGLLEPAQVKHSQIHHRTHHIWSTSRPW